ncbi:PREDICTED: uncharacterized protein LOC109150196 [Ipomoea nil]|uniref:uncharacterized protein LOC109150196 n=1 Tax=Ipomoea nil TaxID=35883 RepID=UPI0009012E30|nr:PREDICTED: uncharacterized protein LOC109150196 [Ipomoea nil]
MKRSISRAISLCSRNVYPILPTNQTPIRFPSLRPPPSSILMHYRFFTSENPNPNCPIPELEPEQFERVADTDCNDSQDLSNEALKKRIERLIEGDGEAIPEIFEVILKRKLSGKSEEADEELMKDIRSHPQLDRIFSDKEFDVSDEDYDDSGKEDESD